MPIRHKFKQSNWMHNGEAYATHNAILDTVPFKPSILVLGTFNPEQPGNMADFFYGRNYFWPAVFNLFVHHNYHYVSRRDTIMPVEPLLDDIQALCKSCKIVFADLISEILHHENPEYQIIEAVRRGRPIQQIHFNNNVYNAINDNDLNDLDDLGQVNWTTPHIIKYLQDTPTIETVYITRNPQAAFNVQWLEIQQGYYNREIDFRRIFTPSGMGGAPGIPRMRYIIKHWLGAFPSLNYEGLDLQRIETCLSREIIDELLLG